MDKALKNRYSFRLGTTSFIYPDDYVSNVRQLAPYFDEIELLLFESAHLPSGGEIDDLKGLALNHDITYNVHLPMDIDLAADKVEIRQLGITAIAKAIDRVAPLEPTTHTLHLTFHQTEKGNALVDTWQKRAAQSVAHLLKSTDIDAGRLSIETLDFSPLWLAPVVEMLDLSICVDVGHLILHGFDLAKVLDLFAARTTILHLHGVVAGRDHLSVRHLEPDNRNTISRYLKNFKGSVSIEVFSIDQLTESMACFPDLMDFVS